MNYKIFEVDGIWGVYSGYTYYGEWEREHVLFSSSSIADCYAWIKAKTEGLLG